MLAEYLYEFCVHGGTIRLPEVSFSSAEHDHYLKKGGL